MRRGAVESVADSVLWKSDMQSDLISLHEGAGSDGVLNVGVDGVAVVEHGRHQTLVVHAHLGHDLGHTSFGHAGEAVLNEISPGGFRHPEQSLRVVDVLEKEGKGLNLTHEVRDGILKHSKGEGDI